MKTNLKRVACVMMSLFMMASGFGCNEAAAGGPFSKNPLNNNLNSADKIRKEEVGKNVKLMADAYIIFCNHETYNELDATEKRTIQEFFKTALQGMNTLGLDLEVAKKVPGLKGIMKDYTDGMANIMQQMQAIFSGSGPAQQQPHNQINDFEDVVVQLVDPKYVDANQKITFPAATAPAATKDAFYGHLYEKTRMLFKGSIEQRIPRMREELSDGPMAMAKQILSTLCL